MTQRLAGMATLLAASLLQGCAATGPVPLYMRGVTNVDVAFQFDAAEAKRLIQPGRNTVSGTAGMLLYGEKEALCSSSAVYLIPATEYAAARMTATFGSVNGGVRQSREVLRFRPEPEEFSQLRREADCDEHGRFRFTGVAAGQFYLVATINVDAGGYARVGSVMRRITVVDGADTDVSVRE